MKLIKLLFILLFGFTYADCFDFTSESECVALDDCEWHADEGACEDAGHDDHDHGECDEDDHVDVDGLILEHNGVEIYSQYQGFINGSVELHVNDTKDISVHFLDSNGDEIVIEDEHDAECYPLSFEIADPSIISINTHDHDDDHDDHDDHDDDHDDHDDHDDDHDDHDGEGHQAFELNGLAMGSTTFVISIMHEGHADYTSMPIYVSVEEEEECVVDGDVNLDGTTNILDCVSMVQYILANISYSDEQLCTADLNGDNTVNVLDIIQIVFFVLGELKAVEANEASFLKTSDTMFMKAKGAVGAVEMTLSHGRNFSIELSEDAFISDYKTNEGTTKLVVIKPGEIIFTSSGDYVVEDIAAATTKGFIQTHLNKPVSISLGKAYPNPFNPSTSFSLDVVSSGYISVKIFNIAGEIVDIIHEGNLNQGMYNMAWNGNDVSSGIYFLQVMSAEKVSTQKLMLVK